jgi:UDP-glucose 4-epimerase
VVRLNSERIRGLGWKNERSCRDALRDSLSAMLVDAQAGRFDA